MEVYHFSKLCEYLKIWARSSGESKLFFLDNIKKNEYLANHGIEVSVIFKGNMVNYNSFFDQESDFKKSATYNVIQILKKYDITNEQIYQELNKTVGFTKSSKWNFVNTSQHLLAYYSTNISTKQAQFALFIEHELGLKISDV